MAGIALVGKVAELFLVHKNHSAVVVMRSINVNSIGKIIYRKEQV
jgi:hypothetical protein